MSDLDTRIEKTTAELETLRSEARALQEQEAGTDLVTSNRAPQAIKREMAALRAASIHKANELEAKGNELRDLVQQRVDKAREQVELEAQRQKDLLQQQLAELEPLRKQVALLEEGIWTINLYAGRDEELRTLRDGDPAPASTPIVIRQRVLAMDEEMAVAAERGGLDSTAGKNDDDMDVMSVFDEWIVRDPANLRQVLPEPKGIVALRPRFRNKKYGEDDFHRAQQAAQGNKRTYFLIRNGDILYRTWTDFKVDENLIPLGTEFTDLFMREIRDSTSKDPWAKRRTPLVPGSKEWHDAEERASELERHYMRVALILEGLLHRTAVFHPIPDSGISFLDPIAHREGKVRFITDMEGLLETGRPSFADWAASTKEGLRTGMRVVGRFRQVGSGRESNIQPAYSNLPEVGKVYTIEDTRDGGFVIRYDDPRAFRGRRVSCLFHESDKQVIGFDRARVEDMEYYLQSRTNRHEYVDMFPVLKSAILAKDDEFKQEAPVRQMLAGVLARENGVSLADAEAAVADLVDWYKLSAKHHKPLVVSDPPPVAEIDSGEFQEAYARHCRGIRSYMRPNEEAFRESLIQNRESRIRSNKRLEKKMVDSIVAEHKSRLGLSARTEKHDHSKRATLLAQIHEDHPDALYIGLKKSGRYIVLTPGNDSNVYVHEHEYNHHGRHFPFTAEWRLPGNRPERSFHELWHSERWEKWERDVSSTEHLTGPEEADVLARILRAIPEDIARDHARFVDRATGSSSRYYKLEDRPVPDTYVGLKPAYEGYDAILYRGAGTIPTARILTNEGSEPDFYVLQYTWTKGRDGVSINSSGPYSRSPSRRDDLLKTDDFIDFNEAALEEAQRELAHWQHFQKLRSDALDLVDGLLSSIEKEWVDNAWRKAKEKFLEDYLDESLWPDHKKAIKINYPYSDHAQSRTWWRSDAKNIENDLRGLVTLCVDRELALDGKTPKDALAIIPDHEFKIPDDLLHLRFTVPKPDPTDLEDELEEADPDDLFHDLDNR